jgi:hypothetical protein
MNTKNLKLLKGLSTGELMTYLTNVRRTDGQWTQHNTFFTVDEILFALEGRGHSPNKEEARMMRQAEDERRRQRKHGRQDR